jgi:hypothetical protein
MEMRFGTWNVRGMYRAGSLRTVLEEVSKYKLDLLGVQEVRWDGGGTEPAGQYTLQIPLVEAFRLVSHLESHWQLWYSSVSYRNNYLWQYIART